MHIAYDDQRVQDACFLVLRLLTRSCSREESERIQKEILVAAAGYMARPTERPANEGEHRAGNDGHC